MKFFSHRAFARRWKSFVLASPNLIQVSLDHCRNHIFLTAAKAKILSFAILPL
jgi:hypothetical protein